MRQATFLRKKVRVSEKDYKKLLNRFNPKKLEVEVERRAKCPFCKKFIMTDCIGCTFRQFVGLGGGGVGCFALMKRVIRFTNFPSLGVDYIFAATENELKGVEKIHKILLTRFKRI